MDKTHQVPDRVSAFLGTFRMLSGQAWFPQNWTVFWNAQKALFSSDIYKILVWNIFVQNVFWSILDEDVKLRCEVLHTSLVLIIACIGLWNKLDQKLVTLQAWNYHPSKHMISRSCLTFWLSFCYYWYGRAIKDWPEAVNGFVRCLRCLHKESGAR